MLKWIPYPMVRVTLFFIGGILLGIFFTDIIPEWSILLLSGSLLILFFVTCFIIKKKESLSGFLGLTLVVLLGYLVLLQKTDYRNQQHLSNFTHPIEAYQAIVTSTPESKENSWKIQAAIVQVKAGGWRKITGNVLLYVSKKKDSVRFNFGDILLIRGTPVLISSPANPFEFDYKRYLSYKSIYHQQFLQQEDVHLISQTDTKGFLYYAAQARQKASSIVRKHVSGQQEQAIALALILGVNEGLDSDLQSAYSASGAMHVLSVSGLHVSILYLTILFLFKPIQSQKWSPWIMTCISIMLLWFYAFITGLSPSVLRAVTMFSFIALAKPFGKRTNMYNTLAASAFLILLFDPYLVMSVGLQLSYLAVIGIVYLQKPIYQLWETKNKIADWIWQITCVSIAAQIATFALGLFYFHQFPVYFLLSNIAVIPGSFIVLILGVFLLIVNWLSPIASITGHLLNFSIQLLNKSVFLVEDLPFSLINGVYLSPVQCALLILLIIAFTLLLEKKKFIYIIYASLIGMLFSSISWWHLSHEVNKGHLVVYSIPGHSAIELIRRGQSTFLADSVLKDDERSIGFHITPYRVFNRVSYISESIPVSKNGFHYFIWNDKKVLWVNKKQANIPQNIITDYLIVATNSLTETQISKIVFSTLIIDSSNSRLYGKNLSARLKEKNKRIYSVLQEGVFIENIEL
jgi:competence protein ComEC